MSEFNAKITASIDTSKAEAQVGFQLALKRLQEQNLNMMPLMLLRLRLKVP